MAVTSLGEKTVQLMTTGSIGQSITVEPREGFGHPIYSKALRSHFLGAQYYTIAQYH